MSLKWTRVPSKLAKNKLPPSYPNVSLLEKQTVPHTQAAASTAPPQILHAAPGAHRGLAPSRPAPRSCLPPSHRCPDACEEPGRHAVMNSQVWDKSGHLLSPDEGGSKCGAPPDWGLLSFGGQRPPIAWRKKVEAKPLATRTPTLPHPHTPRRH